MRRRGFTVIELIAIIALVAIVAGILIPAAARARENARKATCISNIKSVALFCIMYAQDWGDVLPRCVADDEDGTAHAVGGVYANWTIEAYRRDVRTTFGDRYMDGRWMWQLPDALLSGGYIPSLDELTCPTLSRVVDPRFRVETYIVGEDKRTGITDADDPLLSLLPGARGAPGVRKTWRSGSYAYMCMHHPLGTGVQASEYGPNVLSLWDAAVLLGYVGTPGGAVPDPQDYLACGNSVASFDDPVWKPLAMCRSFGVHELYVFDQVAGRVTPVELGGTPRTLPAVTPMAFVDGHAKCVRLGFYDMLAMIFAPNQIAPAPHPRRH